MQPDPNASPTAPEPAAETAAQAPAEAPAEAPVEASRGRLGFLASTFRTALRRTRREKPALFWGGIAGFAATAAEALARFAGWIAR